MKNVKVILSAVIFVSLLLMPVMSVTQNPLPASATPVSIPVSKAKNTETLAVFFTDLDEIKEVPVEEYLFGVVAAEMPAAYETEALKAQAIAAYTYALYKKGLNAEKAYDVTTDSGIDQAYISPEAAAERWGDEADFYTEKIKSVISETSGKVISYDGKIIMSVYCAISPGKTESAKNVWGTDYPYLVPVDSIGDLLSDKYLSTVNLSTDEVYAALSQFGIPTDCTLWFSSPAYSDSGTLLTAAFGDVTLTGSQLRSALKLRSAAFDTVYGEGVFTFNVRGYGHGVGMSQYGADYMAKQGSTAEEILKWYYPGTEIK